MKVGNATDAAEAVPPPAVKRLGLLARYSRWSHDRPVTAFGCVLGVVLLMTGVVVAANLATFIVDDSDKEWVILNDPVTQDCDAAEAAIKQVDRYTTGAGTLIRHKESERGTLSFQFESKTGGSVFNAASLRFMKEIDTLVLSAPRYAEFCQLKYDEASNTSECVDRVSPVLHFFPSKTTLPNGTVVFTPDGLGELVPDIDAVVRSFAQNRRAFGYFLDGAFDDATLVNRITRLKYPMGSPLAGFVAADDRESEQDTLMGEGWLDVVETMLMERFNMKAKFLSTPYMDPAGNGAGTELRWYAGYLRSKDSSSVIGYDLAWAFASILAVWAYMAFHTGSLFVASLGMFEILMSFPVSIFIYRLFFQVTYLGNIQILAIFVVLGIGADDVFVFYDAFKQSAYEPPRVSGTVLGRVTYTAERASKAIFVTSFTTMCAFLATAMSKVMPIAAFGILSATMIVVLFVVNVLFFPPALCLYAKYVQYWCTCGKGKADEVHVASAAPASHEDGTTTVTVSAKGGINNKSFSSDPEMAVESMDLAKMRPIERFFRGPWFAMIASPARWVIIAGFLALLVLGTVLAAQLETPAEQEQWYPSKHMMQAFSNNRASFMSSDEDRVVPVDVLWGLDGMDVKGVSRWKPWQRGSLQVKPEFNPSSEAAQRFMLAVCDEIRTAPCAAEGCRGGNLVRNGKDGKVMCPMEEFAAYLNGSFPVPPAQFYDKLYAFQSSKEGRDMRKHIGFEAPNADGSTPRLFFLRTTAESTLIFPTTARVARPVYAEWEDFVGGLNAKAPPGVSGALQTAYFTWTWMRTQEALVQNTFQGLLLCFVMAFVVLILSTMDILVGFIATVTIAGIVVTVMGVGVRAVMGWDLGIGESIAAVILIGLSVDYCVHLANAYMEAPAYLNTREARVQHALMIMGVSIWASAVTTIISGSILWLCILKFFSKFAFLITATIASSFVWATMFLPAVLYVCGPADHDSWSSLHPLARRVSKRMPSWLKDLCA